jgi:hypothetical protein
VGTTSHQVPDSKEKNFAVSNFHGISEKIFEWKTTGLCYIPIPFSSVIVSSSFTTSSAMTAAIATAQANTTFDISMWEKVVFFLK